MEGHITSDKKYISEYIVPSYQVDALIRLKPAGFMDIAQEAAYLAAEAMGFGYGKLKEKGTAWVLSRMHFRFSGIPLWRDSISVETWSRGPSGPFYIRDFSIKDKNGDIAVACTSSWVILDTANRVLVRSSDVLDTAAEASTCPDVAIETPAEKISLPKGAVPEKAGQRQVLYSDVDLLGHTNNARYVVWAMDCIDYEVLLSRAVKDLRVNFIHESKPGDIVELYRYADGQDTFFVEGRAGDRTVFSMRIDF